MGSFSNSQIAEESRYIDVMNHVQDLMLDEMAKPKNFRENTSDNSIIRSFLGRMGSDINEKFEALLAGGYVSVRFVLLRKRKWRSASMDAGA